MATVALITSQVNKFRDVPEGPGPLVVAIDSNKSDTEFLPACVKAFRVGSMSGGAAVKFTVRNEAGTLTDITRTFAAGDVWDLAPVYRVWSTGTTASEIDGVL
jgi:hypothetical protein